MKKQLLFFFLFFTCASHAQFTVNQDSVYNLFDTDEADIAVYNSHKTSNPVITMKWEIVSVEVSSGWENDFFFCDAVQCWDSTTNSNVYDLLDNKDYPLDCHFLNNGNVGEGNAKIRIWEVGDSSNTVRTVVYHAKVEQSVRIRSLDAVNLEFYPNPATNNINIENIELHEIIKIELFNIIGRKVSEINHPSDWVNINISNLENGAYIIRLTDKSSNNYSQNFIKN